MALYLVIFHFMLAFSLASTNQCVSFPGSSIDLSLHSRKNATGNWIITVDTRRFTMKENPRELTVNVHQETRLCDSNEIEQLVLVAFVHPSLHVTVQTKLIWKAGVRQPCSLRGFTNPRVQVSHRGGASGDSRRHVVSCVPNRTLYEYGTSMPGAMEPNATSTTNAPSTRITAAPSTNTAPSTRITAAPSTTTAPSTRITAAPSTTTAPSTRITAAPSTTTAPSTRITAAPSTTTTATTTTTSTIRRKSCPRSGYQLFPEFNCYKAFPSVIEMKTWSGARDQCRRDGGDLMVMETERERKEVFIPLFNSVNFYFGPWMGVYIPQGGDGWMTVKGEPALSTWWAPGEPDKDAYHRCTYATSQGLLRKWNCANRWPFICEIPLLGSHMYPERINHFQF